MALRRGAARLTVGHGQAPAEGQSFGSAAASGCHMEMGASFAKASDFFKKRQKSGSLCEISLSVNIGNKNFLKIVFKPE